MLVVDAGCLYELVTDGERRRAVQSALDRDPDAAAPHIVDVETFGIIRRDRMRGVLDTTGASLAVAELEAWPGERFDHRGLLARAWELRDAVRGWDAMYVALAEALDAVLLTTDARLARAHGTRCTIEVPDG